MFCSIKMSGAFTYLNWKPYYHVSHNWYTEIFIKFQNCALSQNLWVLHCIRYYNFCRFETKIVEFIASNITHEFFQIFFNAKNTLADKRLVLFASITTLPMDKLQPSYTRFSPICVQLFNQEICTAHLISSKASRKTDVFFIILFPVTTYEAGLKIQSSEHFIIIYNNMI